MVAKSIVQVQVDDEQFKKFEATYNKYVESLKKLPGAWGDHNEAVKATGVNMLELVAALFAQSELTHKTKDNQEKVEKSAKKTAGFWKEMARDTKETAKNIFSATEQLLKWAGLTSVFAGLVGAGGLFGIERLATSASNYRKQGFGANATPGELRAFQIDYQKYLSDPAGFLGNVNRVVSTPSEQWGIGGQAAAMASQGLDSAQIATKLLPAMVDQFTKLGGLGRAGSAIYSAYGFDRFASFEDFQRMARMRNELAASGDRYAKDAADLSTPDSTSKRWQDFMMQLDRAGNKIETIFVNDLAPLEPGLEKLSDAVVKVVDSFMRNPNFPRWLDEASAGMEKLAKWLGALGGSSAVSSSTDDSRWYARDANRFAWGNVPKGSYAAGNINPLMEGKVEDSNNSFGLRLPGSKTFRSFNDRDDSVRASYRQLVRDIKVHHLRTLREIISDETWGWAPASDGNDDAAYLRSLKKSTGIDPDAPLSGDDRNQLASILAGISRVEQPKHPYSQEQVVRIINQTGGSAVISTNQVAQ